MALEKLNNIFSPKPLEAANVVVGNTSYEVADGQRRLISGSNTTIEVDDSATDETVTISVLDRQNQTVAQRVFTYPQNGLQNSAIAGHLGPITDIANVRAVQVYSSETFKAEKK